MLRNTHAPSLRTASAGLSATAARRPQPLRVSKTRAYWTTPARRVRSGTRRTNSGDAGEGATAAVGAPPAQADTAYGLGEESEEYF